MDRKARTGDTQLVKSREMRSQTLVVVAGGGGVKTTEKNTIVASAGICTSKQSWGLETYNPAEQK